MSPENKEEKLSRFWIGPFLAGTFLGIGYGVTHRLMILQGNWQAQTEELFSIEQVLPGKRLSEFRKDSGVKDSSLLVDLNAYARQIAQEKKVLEAQKLAEIQAQKKKTLKAQKLAEIQAQKKKTLEAQKLAEIQAQKKKALEAQKLAEIQAQKKKALEAQKNQMQFILDTLRKVEVDNKTNILIPLNTQENSNQRKLINLIEDLLDP